MTYRIEGPFPLTVRPTESGADLEVTTFLTRAVFLQLFADAAEVAAPDFFQPGHTYVAVDAPFTFHCVTHTVWPDGRLRALGRSAWTERTELHWLPTEFAPDDWAGGAWGGWTDVTGAGETA